METFEFPIISLQKAFEQFQQQTIRIANSTDNKNEESSNVEPARKRKQTTAGDNRAVIAKEV